jgi:hypothetical protein
MANVLFFSRNRCTSVEQIDERTLRCSCRLQDTLTDAFVEVRVKIPDLEITGITGEVRRGEEMVHPGAFELLGKALGVRIGPGMVKIIKGLIGNEEGLDELIFMVEECCQGVILSFTKGELAEAPREEMEARKFYARLVRENTRLYKSCIAFAPDSPLVQGMELPGAVEKKE